MACIMPSKTGYFSRFLLCSLLSSVASLAYSEVEFTNETASKDKQATTDTNETVSDTQTLLPTGAELPLPAEAKTQLDELELRLAKLHEESGNFSTTSGEFLLEMKKFYQDARQHEEAGKLLRQAMQVERINHGLYSEQQMPAAKLLVEIWLPPASGVMPLRNRNFAAGSRIVTSLQNPMSIWKCCSAWLIGNCTLTFLPGALTIPT